MLRRLSVKRRVTLGFAGVLFTMLAAISIAGGQLHRAYRLNIDLSRERVPKAAAASDLGLATVVRESSLRGYLGTGNMPLRQQYEVASLDSKDALSRLNRFPQSERERQILDDINLKAQQFSTEAEDALALADAGHMQEAEARQQLHVEPLVRDVLRLTHSYSDISRAILDEGLNGLDDHIRRTYIEMALAGLLGLIVAAIFIVTTTFAVGEPVRRLMKAADAVQKDDYDAVEELDKWHARTAGTRGEGKNEMLRLASTFTSMVSELRKRQNRLSAYGQVSEICASTIDLRQLLSNVTAKLAALTESQLGIAYVTSEDGSRLVPVAGFATDSTMDSRELAIGEGIPGLVAKRGATMVVNDVPQDGSFAIKLGVAEFNPRAVVSVPLASEGEILGVMTFASVHDYTEDTIDFLDKSSGAVAAAVHNAVTHAQVNGLASELQETNGLLEEHNQELQAQNEEIHAQSEELSTLNSELAVHRESLERALDASEAKAHQLSTLWEVGQAITASLGLEQLVSTMEDQIRQLLDADASSILLYDEEHSTLLTAGGKQLRRRRAVAEHVDQCEMAAHDVARTGKPRIIEGVANCEHCRYSAMACSDGGSHHMLSVPMFYQGQVIGAINAFRQNKDVFTEADLQALSTLASAAAVAFENSKAYEREHGIAEKLQKSFLPGDEFTIPGFSVGCHYTPATEEFKVGGDFYDVIDLGNNRAAIVMGDVSGKGIDAAMYTAMVKYMLRGLVMSSMDPCDSLAKLNDAMTELAPPEIFVTLFLGILDINGREMTYANAGHDLPLFYSCGKSCCAPCEVTGRALGMMPGATYTSRTISFNPGDLLVMYTDGITDARQNGRFLGADGLEKIVCRFAEKTADEIVKGVFEGVIEFAARKLNDDAAVLVVKAAENG